jgi:enoyl-CoA hydratase/carnithine racemase
MKPTSPSDGSGTASATEDLVLVERPADRVAHVVLNRPERRNALTGPLADRLAETIEALNHDDSVSVLVIRGAGGAFCSGLDLKEFNLDPKPDWVPEFGSKWRRVHRALFNSDRIVVGALERAAVNGGAALALACDFLVAGETAFLQVGEIQQGMAAPMNMAWLRLRFSEALAGRVALLGDRLAGPDLVRLGIAYAAVADETVVAAADELAARLAAHDPIGARRIKASLRRTGVDETAEQWFARALAADPLAGQATSPRAAEDA